MANKPADLGTLCGNRGSLQVLELEESFGPVEVSSILAMMDLECLHPEGATADAILLMNHVAALSI